MTDNVLFTQPAPFENALVVYGEGWTWHLTFALRVAPVVLILVTTDAERTAAQQQINPATCHGEIDILLEAGGPAAYLVSASHVDVVVTCPSSFEYFAELNDRWEGDEHDGFNILLPPDEPGTAPQSSAEPAEQPFRLASIGGTFNTFHDGHARYFQLALRLAARIHVFVADDDYAKSRKEYQPKRLSDRSQIVGNYLRKTGHFGRAEIEPLRHPDDIGKYVVCTEELDLVLAERLYVPWFIQWNKERTVDGLEPCAIMCKPRATHYGQALASSLWASAEKATPASENAWLFEETSVR